MSREKKTVCIAYVPVVHEGYRRFFLTARAQGARALYVLGRGVLSSFPRLERDMRALPPEVIADMVRVLGIFDDVFVCDTAEAILPMVSAAEAFSLPDEDVSRDFAERHLHGCSLSFESIFLRWDMKAALSKKPPLHDRTVSCELLDCALMKEAFSIAKKSSDWWRQVGAVLVKDGAVLYRAWNTHMPSAQSPYIEGDPRSNFDAGERIDISTAAHAEKRIVAWAARDGSALSGASLYVSTFPCPDCARVISEAGIKKVYYADGYSLLEADRIFKHHGIECILVE